MKANCCCWCLSNGRTELMMILSCWARDALYCIVTLFTGVNDFGTAPEQVENRGKHSKFLWCGWPCDSIGIPTARSTGTVPVDHHLLHPGTNYMRDGRCCIDARTGNDFFATEEGCCRLRTTTKKMTAKQKNNSIPHDMRKRNLPYVVQCSSPSST